MATNQPEGRTQNAETGRRAEDQMTTQAEKGCLMKGRSAARLPGFKLCGNNGVSAIERMVIGLANCHRPLICGNVGEISGA